MSFWTLKQAHYDLLFDSKIPEKGIVACKYDLCVEDHVTYIYKTRGPTIVYRYCMCDDSNNVMTLHVFPDRGHFYLSCPIEKLDKRAESKEWLRDYLNRWRRFAKLKKAVRTIESWFLEFYYRPGNPGFYKAFTSFAKNNKN